MLNVNNTIYQKIKKIFIREHAIMAPFNNIFFSVF